MNTSSIASNRSLNIYQLVGRNDLAKNPQPHQLEANQRPAADVVILSRDALNRAKQPEAQPAAKSNNTTTASIARAATPAAPAAPVIAPAAPAATPAAAPAAAPTAPVLEETASPETTSSPESPRRYGTVDLEIVRSAFGAKKGDERYTADADLDGNGTVDFKDFTQVLSSWGQIKP